MASRPPQPWPGARSTPAPPSPRTTSPGWACPGSRWTRSRTSGALQGAAQGGTGCLFSLGVDGGASAGLTILSHPDGGAYFDATVARLAEAAPIPGLGDDARSGHDRPGSTTVITRRGSRVVEVRIGRTRRPRPQLLIAIAACARTRTDHDRPDP
ncbi:MAG: hypothetical protein R2746_16115 [Acidimicrobiales bacterium]